MHRGLDLAHEVRLARERVEHWRGCDEATLAMAREELRTNVRALVAVKMGR